MTKTKTKRRRGVKSAPTPQPATVQEVLTTMRTIAEGCQYIEHCGASFASFCDELLPYVKPDHRLHVATLVADKVVNIYPGWRSRLPMVRLGMALTNRVRENMEGWLPGKEMIDPEPKTRRERRKAP